ncbi:MAG: hypothetical protein ACPGU5_06525 [Lishizhenia sp.]
MTQKLIYDIAVAKTIPLNMYAKLNVFMRIFSFLTLFFTSNFLFSQIETSGEVEVKEMKEKKQKEVVQKSGVEIFVNYHGLQSNRTLEENVSPWGNPLNEKADEVGEWVNCFSTGVRAELGSNIYIDMGVGYFSNKQSYLFETTDSSFASTEIFRHIGIPLKIAFITPGEIGFYLSAGAMPKAFMGQKIKREINTSAVGKQTENLVERDGFERVLIDLTASAGVRADLSEKYGVTLALEGRRQLNNNYNSQGPYIRKSYHLGFSFGFQFYL